MTFSAPLIERTEQKTTITDTSSHDNIWFDPLNTPEITALLEILASDEEMYGNDDRLTSLEVSDHRSVAMWINTSRPDDDIRFERVIAHPTSDEAVTLKNHGTSGVVLGGCMSYADLTASAILKDWVLRLRLGNKIPYSRPFENHYGGFWGCSHLVCRITI